MSQTPGIEFHGIWKKFRRGEIHNSLRDLIPALTRRALGRVAGSGSLTTNEFWALRDVSFSVQPGQTLGVIGNNGAGKSTLLKILTRILRPSQGHYAVRGRIGALIEVSSGFHPDLTGRENIFLQGAMMGMSRSQSRRKMDEIIAFSEIERFIDTPVKRYSSGMNARLGFSIAAHLDPDVLIIDEVLAVGDYAFQRKAFGRIHAMARQGMPVIVVSHQLDRVAELCTEVLLLAHGEVVLTGPPTDVIGAYMRGTVAGAPGTVPDESPLVFEQATLLSGTEVRSGEYARIRITGTTRHAIAQHVEPVAILLRSAQSGDLIYITGTSVFGLPFAPGPFTLDVELQMNVQPGIYLADIGVWDRADERQILAGPSLNIRVTEERVFLGTINMNARMQLQASGAPADATRGVVA